MLSSDSWELLEAILTRNGGEVISIPNVRQRSEDARTAKSSACAGDCHGAVDAMQREQRKSVPIYKLSREGSVWMAS